MFKVKVLTEGKIKENWLEIALREYEKRLKGRMTIQWVIDPNFEAIALKEKNLIALDPIGDSFSSEGLSEALYSNWGTRPSFVIGGATGLSKEVQKHAKVIWSLSSLTFTHQIVRLILIEQLYRSLEIHQGSSYHK